MDTQISNARRIRELAATRPDEVALRYVAIDGTGSAATWAELDRRSSQLAAALAGRGLTVGDRLGSAATKVNRGALVAARDA